MKRLIKFLVFTLVLFIPSILFTQQESITITTYYPSPYGSYRTLEVINDNEQILIGNDSNNPAIELRDRDAIGLTPYIDFSNDAFIDFDARIILTGNDELTIRGARLNVDGNRLESRGLIVHGNTITICDD